MVGGKILHFKSNVSSSIPDCYHTSRPLSDSLDYCSLIGKFASEFLLVRAETCKKSEQEDGLQGRKSVIARSKKKVPLFWLSNKWSRMYLITT